MPVSRQRCRKPFWSWLLHDLLPAARPPRARAELEMLEHRLVPASLLDLADFNTTNGSMPLSALVTDGNGNLFGTSSSGGANNDGNIFEVKAGSNIITDLSDFNGVNGSAPEAGLLRDGQGNLFGTAFSGGANGLGDVFELKAGSSSVTDLADFNTANGQNPQSQLIMDGGGNFFGTAQFGGANGFGDVFELKAGSNTLTDLADFNATDGAYPRAGVVRDGSGNLFGTASSGGSSPDSSDGTVFEVKAGSGTITDLADFLVANGSQPLGGVVLDGHGNLFGAANMGGANGLGDIFELKSGGTIITDVADFNSTNGAAPSCDLLMDGNGNLFGTAVYGGANNLGDMFELPVGSSTIIDLADFNTITGAHPQAGVLMDANGNLFGTASLGGANNQGTVFEATSVPQGSNFDELGAYRPGDGSWSLDSNGQFGFQTGGPEGKSPLADRVITSFSLAQQAGGPTVIPVSGDWAGLGTTEIGDFENGTWHLDLNNNGILDNGETFTFGTTGDIPVPGTYFTKGRVDLAVFRSVPAQGFGEFIISDDHWLAEAQAGQPIGMQTSFIYGAAGDRVVVGDWNGVGLTEVGVFRDAAAFGAPGAAVFSLDVANHHAFDSSNKVFIFGTFTDGVVIGDWDGSGTSKVGVYRPATAFGAPNTAVFSLDETGDFQFDANSRVFLFGLPTDKYVTGRWAFTTSTAAATTPGRAVSPLQDPTALDAFFASS